MYKYPAAPSFFQSLGLSCWSLSIVRSSASHQVQSLVKDRPKISAPKMEKAGAEKLVWLAVIRLLTKGSDPTLAD